MAYWLFQGNPKYYRVLDAIKDFDQMPWLVTRYAQDIAPGDGVMVWVSGTQAGIYALAEVTEPAQLIKNIPDKKYWIDASRALEKQQAMIRFTHKLLKQPLLKSNLLQDPILETLLVIRAPNSTNFKVSPQEWQRVQELIKE
ncbi:MULTISPECIES: EVE domain-containing protein [Nostocales]|uniref:EVE domain-containing protein n=2 Tax=Tolypothrix TaxID=111782 RepID=A0A0C1R212_9CYAN